MALTRGIGVLLGTGFVLMWSSGFIGAELARDAAAPETVLAWRMILMTLVLGVVVVCRRRPIATRGLVLHTVVGALAQAGYLYGVVAAASNGVSAGTSALIAALQPLVAAAAAAVFLGESVRGRQVVGLLLGIGGVALVVSGDLGVSGAPAWAFALPGLAMLSLVAGTLVERRYESRVGLPEALAIQCAVSAAIFTGFSLSTGGFVPPATSGFWFAVVWVVVLSGIGGYGFYWASLARMGVGRVSSLLYLTPPVTVLWSWFMFATPVSLSGLLGLVVSAFAVVLVMLPGRASRSDRVSANAPAEVHQAPEVPLGAASPTVTSGGTPTRFPQ
ncbi:DMT family transporter [Spiractinospora alimapuensis]|uniref:DMT family transporter n=1 Tax=Spiractinospora alimapuensis TaxID=2820884 RepID=UPI001F315D21|nr:DMT family transporter [Spiractinospora alimapuensis]QVQ50006.1 DMT family transporter [Spiractinospora alimapuensis]